MNGAAGRERTHFGSFMREVGAELTSAAQQRSAAIAPGGPNWRQLFKGTTPIQGESLRGLVARACQRNDLPNSWGLLQHLGQRHRNRVLVAEDPNIDPAELGYAIRVDEEEVRARRYDSIGSQRWSFFGLKLNQSSIERRVRHFSPTALRGPGDQYHRATWELRDIPFCLDGWDMLQDRCGCERGGVVQGWTRTLTKIEECDACGDPLEWLEPFPVPARMRPALSLLEVLVDPRPQHRESVRDRLPADLGDADRSTTFDLILRMAAAIDPKAALWPIDDPARRLHGLHSACQALKRWPKGVDAIRWHPATSNTAIASILNSWIELPRASNPGQPTTRLPTKRRDEAAPIGLRPATEITKLSKQVLLEAWERGLITRHYRAHGAHTLPAFEREEVLSLKKEWDERINSHALAYRLGISYHGIEQMVALGVLPAEARALPGAGPYLLPATVTRFLSDLTRHASTTPDTLPLKEAMTRIGGRPKPWGPIFKALLAGDLRFGLRAKGKLAERIMIPSGEAARMTAMTFNRDEHPHMLFCDRIIQRDALDMLNVSPTYHRLLHGLPYVGTNPKTYAALDVEQRAREIVSIPEIAAILRMTPSAAYWRLRRLSLREVIPGGWDRAILAKLV